MVLEQLHIVHMVHKSASALYNSSRSSIFFTSMYFPEYRWKQLRIRVSSLIRSAASEAERPRLHIVFILYLTYPRKHSMWGLYTNVHTYSSCFLCAFSFLWWRWSVGPDDNMLVVPTKNNMLWDEQHKKTGDINVLRKRRSSGCFSSVFTITIFVI
jgi:hypothetical protein